MVDHYRGLLDALPDAIAIVEDDGVISAVNDRWRDFSAHNGGDVRGTREGINYLDVCDRAALGGDEDAATVAAGLRGVLAGSRSILEYEYNCPSPVEDRWFVVRITPLGGRGAVISHLDITSRRNAELLLVEHASRDALTGLSNRAVVLASLRRLISAIDRRGGSLALLFIDLDGFKNVNDELGHAGGDVVLAVIGDRLQTEVRGGDLVGRIGGDEFVVVTDAAGADEVAERVRHIIAAPIQVAGREVAISASIGMATARSDPQRDPELAAHALLARADAAMYDDKAHRKPASANRRQQSPL